MANKSSTVKINFQFDEKALKNVTGLLKNLTTVMSGLQKQTQSTNRTLDAFMRRIDKLEKSPIVKKGIKIGLLAPSGEQNSSPRETAAQKKQRASFTPEGRPSNLLTTNINDYAKNGTKYQAKAAKAEEKELLKAQKAEDKKLKDEEQAADIASIKITSALNLGLEVFKFALDMASKAVDAFMKILNAGIDSAEKTQQDAMFARSVGLDPGTFMSYKYGMESISVDSGNANSLADIANKLLMQQQGTGALLGTDYGDMIAALAKSGAIGATELESGVNAAIQTGDIQEVMNAILQGLADSDMSGLNTRAIADALGLPDLGGLSEEQLKQLFGFVDRGVEYDEEGSRDLTGSVTELKLLFFEALQRNVGTMAKIIDNVIVIFELLEPAMDWLVGGILYLTEVIMKFVGWMDDKFGESSMMAAANENFKAYQDMTMAEQKDYRTGQTRLSKAFNIDKTTLGALFTPELIASMKDEFKWDIINGFVPSNALQSQLGEIARDNDYAGYNDMFNAAKSGLHFEMNVKGIDGNAGFGG